MNDVALYAPLVKRGQVTLSRQKNAFSSIISTFIFDYSHANCKLMQNCN